MAGQLPDHPRAHPPDRTGFRAANHLEKVHKIIESHKQLQSDPLLHQLPNHRRIQLNCLPRDPHVIEQNPNALDTILLLLLSDIKIGHIVFDQYVGDYLLQQFGQLLLG